MNWIKLSEDLYAKEVDNPVSVVSLTELTAQKDYL